MLVIDLNLSPGDAVALGLCLFVVTLAWIEVRLRVQKDSKPQADPKPTYKYVVTAHPSGTDTTASWPEGDRQILEDSLGRHFVEAAHPDWIDLSDLEEVLQMLYHEPGIWLDSSLERVHIDIRFDPRSGKGCISDRPFNSRHRRYWELLPKEQPKL